jgi:hypothetical protein
MLVQTGPVGHRLAPLGRRPRVLLDDVRPGARGDGHGHSGPRIYHWREFVGPIGVGIQGLGTHGGQLARLREISGSESDVMGSDVGQSSGELGRFFCAGQELGVQRSADN